MQASSRIRDSLITGDRRTVRGVSDVVSDVLKHPELACALAECLFDPDAGVRMRAADALEKVSRVQTGHLQRYTAVLIDLFEESEQQEVRWHLAVLLPRLRLDAQQRRRTSEVLQMCMDSKSSIVKTCALQGMADLAMEDASLMPRTLDLLMSAERTGTPAMKARSRKLLRALTQAGQPR